MTKNSGQKTRRLLFFAGAAFLLSMSVPTMAMAADSFKDVIVRTRLRTRCPFRVSVASR